jgi:hypothetical protein
LLRRDIFAQARVRWLEMVADMLFITAQRRAAVPRPAGPVH